jgi:putative cell wall-binding protein
MILGGTRAVSKKVESRLKRKLGKSRVVRLAGADAYSTASVIASRSVKLRHAWDGVTIVNVARPTEAVCGAAMAGRLGSVVLYSRRTSLPKATRTRLGASRYRIDTIHLFGAKSSIGSAASAAVKKALGG